MAAITAPEEARVVRSSAVPVRVAFSFRDLDGGPAPGPGEDAGAGTRVQFTTGTAAGAATSLYFGHGAQGGAPAAARPGMGPNRLDAPQLGLLGAGDGAAFSNLVGGARATLAWHRGEAGNGAPGGGTLAQLWIDAPAGAGRVALGAGALREDGALFRSSAAGGFGSFGDTPSRFLTVAGTAPLGRGWEAVGTATRASASPEVATGMLTNWGAVTASAFAAGVRASGVWHAGDTLGITLGQPLRVERASADFTYAAGQTSEGVLVFQTARVSRSPPDARSTWRLPTTAR